MLVLNFTPAILLAADRDDLYHLGRAQFKNNNCVDALKNLYAFYVINEEVLETQEKFKTTLTENIKNCETRLSLAVASNDNLQIRDGVWTIENGNIDRGFRGTGMEIEDFLKKHPEGLEKMMNQRQGLSNSPE